MMAALMAHVCSSYDDDGERPSLPANCVKKQVKARNLQNTNRKIYTFVIEKPGEIPAQMTSQREKNRKEFAKSDFSLLLNMSSSLR